MLAGLISIIVWESKYPAVARIIGIIIIDGLTVLFGSEWMIHPVFAKWFFYIVYPLHFVLIYLIVIMITT